MGMNVFSATELKQELSSVLNMVQAKGCATIKHRSRPDMVLIDKQLLEDALINDKGKAEIIADLTF